MRPRGPHAPAEASSVPSQAEYMICKICLFSLLIPVHCVRYYNPLIPFHCTPVKAVILRFMGVAMISPSSGVICTIVLLNFVLLISYRSPM